MKKLKPFSLEKDFKSIQVRNEPFQIKKLQDYQISKIKKIKVPFGKLVNSIIQNLQNILQKVFWGTPIQKN